MLRDVKDLVNILKPKQLEGRPLIVAIDGFGGSGKTTLATKLADTLGSAYVVHMDDFIIKDKMQEESWEEGFDRKRLEEQVLIPLSTGKEAKYQQLIWESNLLGEYQTVPPVKYVIVEGISSSHPNIAKYYDYKIWVDTPIQVAKARGKNRDAGNENEGMWDLWAENDLKYLHQYHPEAAADTVVNGY